jgi:hypothetical protein
MSALARSNHPSSEMRCPGEEATLAASRQSGNSSSAHVYALEGHPTASQHQPPDEVGEGGAGGVVKHRLPTIIVIDFLPYQRRYSPAENTAAQCSRLTAGAKTAVGCAMAQSSSDLTQARAPCPTQRHLAGRFCSPYETAKGILSDALCGVARSPTA